MGFLLVIGLPPLNVQNIAWLAKGDPLFNYVGWEIFRQGQWNNPIGLNPNYGLEFSSSIVYSDSIPLVAIFFKIFSALLPAPFQYFGLWYLLCFILQAYFAYKLAGLFTASVLNKCCISFMALFFPAMMFRVNVHIALAGHFLLLWALYLSLRKKDSQFSWAILLCVALGIHFYLFVMVFAIWLGYQVDAWRFKKVKLAHQLLWFEITLGLLLVCAYEYGYFAIATGASSDAGYGAFQANLLSIFNPEGWSIFLHKKLYVPPNIESFNYLGLGLIGAILFGILPMGKTTIRREVLKTIDRHSFLLLSIIMLALIAITHNVDIGKSHITFPLNEKILFLLGIVRASGRLIWPALYLLVFATFWLIVTGYSKRIATVLLVTLASIQVADTSAGWLSLREFFEKTQGNRIEHSLSNEFWSSVHGHYSSIKLVPPRNWPEGWNTYAIFASQNKMATNAVFLARHDISKALAAKAQLDNDFKEGNLDPKTIYVFQKWGDNLFQVSPKIDSTRDLFARIDGINVLAPNYKLCKTCKPIVPELEITSLIPAITVNERVQFLKGMRGEELLIRGWSWPETWGTWSSGMESSLALPLGNKKPSQIQFTFRAVVGPNHPISRMSIYINGEYQETIEIKKQLNNVFTMPIPTKWRSEKFIVLEFKYLNPSSPKNAGFGNQDERLLTFGLETVELLP